MLFASEPAKGVNVSDFQPMRREQDRISVIETRVRATLLGGQQGRPTAPLALSFIESLRMLVADVTMGMQELLVEVWLRDIPPWGHDGTDEESVLRCYASMALLSATTTGREASLPADILLSVVTAGRPLRFDDAFDHPLVRTWTVEVGVNPDTVGAFLGIPIFAGTYLLGVLAVALADAPSSEHATFIDALAHYIAASAEHARLRYQLHAQRELAQTVLREAPLAAAVLRVEDNRIVLTNPLFDSLLQIGPDVWGQRLEAVLPDHAQQLRSILKLDEVRRSGETRVIMDQPIRLSSGVTYWDFTCSPVHDASGALEAILVAGVNVTARVAQRQRQKRSVDLAQERVLQMVELHRISLDVASQLGQDLPRLLRQILEKMSVLVQASGGMVFYNNRENGDLECVISDGLPNEYAGVRLPRGAGLPGRVAVTGESQRVNDYPQYPLRTALLEDNAFRAVAAVPMKQRNQVIGVMCLVKLDALSQSQQKFPDEEISTTFSEDDLWLLELFAMQAAHALENTRTYLDLDRAYQQQRSLDRQKDDFIMRASHDLRLPLTNVVGYLDLSIELLGGETAEVVRPLLQQAADEAQRLRELMDQLLEQAQLESGKRAVHLTAIVLGPVVDEVVQARRQQVILHGTPHRFEVDISPNIVISADLARLKEILENLLSNAVKYSPNGGTIRVDAQFDDPQQTVQLAVSDTGIGIPSEAHEQIFERFMRVESPVASEISGTGLGLYLARQLVESMGGSIRLARSIPGEGSVFVVTLPLVANDLPMSE